MSDITLTITSQISSPLEVSVGNAIVPFFFDATPVSPISASVALTLPPAQGSSSAFVLRGEWDSSEIYREFDVVTDNGSSYVYKNKTPSSGVPPMDQAYWMILASSERSDDSSYNLKLAKIQYIDFENAYWGSTNEEKARNIAKFDIHVSGGINERTIPIINRARQLNPNLKICYYISVASARPWYNEGWYTFRRGCVWDESWANEQSLAHNVVMTRPSTKWDIYQEIEQAHHVGGEKTGNRLFIETFEWVDENGDTHFDDKFIDEYTGGVSYDGFFWDDVGFDANIADGLFYDSDNSSTRIESIKRQGFTSRRDKYICINQFARDRGMFVIPNSIDPGDLFDTSVSASNPDGLGSSLTENDFVFVESCITMVGTSNSVVWRDEVHRVVNYLNNWYEIVGAKIICEDYIYGGVDERTRDYLITFMMATYASVGAHYFAITDIDVQRPTNDLFVPNVFALPVPKNHDDRKIHLTNLVQNVYKYNYAATSLSVTRERELTSGEVNEYGILNGTKIILNGNRIINAFLSNPEVYAEIKTDLTDFTHNINNAISDSKRNASIYNRLMIDDWSVSNLEFSNLITDAVFTAWGNGSTLKNEGKGANTSFSVKNRSLAWALADLGEYYQTEYMTVRIYPEHYGHTIEFGFKLTTDGNGVGAWIDAWIDGNLWFETSANPIDGKSTLYPDRSDMFVVTKNLIDYGTRDYVDLTFLGSWNQNSTSAVFESMYVIDVDEFEEDITKAEFTNLLPAPSSCIAYSNPHLMSLTQLESRSFEVEMRESAVVDSETIEYIEGNGPAWWVNPSKFLKQGHTYEIGMLGYEVTNGTIAFNFGLNTDYGTLCGDIPLGRKIKSRVFQVDTYNKVFSIPEDAVFGSSLLCVRYFLSIGETIPSGFRVVGWYLYDIDEENVIIRGFSPSNTSIMIARVTDENFETESETNMLLKNTLYITNTGRMYITDINKNVVNLIT